MKITLKRLALAIAGAGLLTIYGCGGGGGTGVAGATSSGLQIIGTAATGGALANAPVAVTNSAGASPCVETSITTTALGSYVCTLKVGEVAPFFIVITDPTGDIAPLVSIATQTPAAGTPLTVNATPLTTAIIAQLNNGDALGLVATHAVNTANLALVTKNVLQQLAPVLANIGITNYDPFTTSITAATAANTGNTADLVLDMVKITTDSTGALALATIENPTPVPMASAGTTGNPLPALTATAATLGQAAQVAAATFNACFAVPAAQRALTTGSSLTGGPSVTSVATACKDIATDGVNANGAAAYLNNGYTSGEAFYSMLTSSAMDGAKFSVPEIMAYYPANPKSKGAALSDRAVINVRYIDSAGNPGNVITTATDIPGSNTNGRASTWWLVGNQQNFDVRIRTVIRRVEHLNPATTTNPSTFQTGLDILIDTSGPNTGLTAAQVNGPGLPTAGLWLFKNPLSNSSFMDISTYRNPTTPNANAYTAACTAGCPLFWFAKTNGVTSALNGYVTNSTSALWAQGNIEGSYAGIGSVATPPMKGGQYTFALYNGTTVVQTITKPLLTDLVDPAVGHKLPWNTIGSSSLAALDPNIAPLNGTPSSLSLDWVQNSAAQQIGTASAWTALNAYSTGVNVTKGTTTAVVTAPANTTFKSVVSGRALLFGYRMLDGTSKSAVFLYN